MVCAHQMLSVLMFWAHTCAHAVWDSLLMESFVKVIFLIAVSQQKYRLLSCIAAQILMNVMSVCLSVCLKPNVRIQSDHINVFVSQAILVMALYVMVSTSFHVIYFYGCCIANVFFVNTDIDECNVTANPCDIDAACINIPGYFYCQCNPGYTGNGTVCEGWQYHVFIRCNLPCLAQILL